MSFFADIPLENKKADQVEAMMAAGGKVPPGFYHATLHGAKEITSNAKGTPGCELTFEVSGGIFKGCHVTDTLWKTDAERTQDRIILFGLRLGVLARDPKTQKVVPVEGKQDFMDVLDTKCIIEVVEETYKRDDSSVGSSSRIAFGGIYYPDDKKAAEKVGKAAAATATASTTTAKDKDAKPTTKSGTNGKVDVSKL
jgi:hypothetical protein